MRIHSALATVAVASVAALTAFAAPASAEANRNDWRAHAGVSSSVVPTATCTVTPASVNMYTEARDITFDAPGITDPWLINDELFAAADPVFTFQDGDTAGATWTFDPHYYSNSEAGSKQLDVYSGTDLSDENAPYDVCQAPFSFKRGAKISAGVKASGDYRTVAGKVSQSSWGATPKYVAVKGGTVDIQKFLGGVWSTRRTVTTDTTGAYTTKMKAAAGQWRAVYRGTSQIGSRTSAEYTG